MRNLDLVPGGAGPASDERYDVAFTDEEGEQRLPLTKAWQIPFESCLPVRATSWSSPPSRSGCSGPQP
ncbi:hypothetical protein LZG04_14360 [Saccharothrix sp. S26]|uniref:hypothetical protein n=1 Tax=Saccharothrix sp. S26 TaxID=2907215 RepID=UPI001F25DA3D|nr:hypothetical protein [Saccharothrix sp. S26]MCE6995977.1 hypothetical protein [Saccharothrix sp. S26]